jgi:hypothetical protein
LLEIESQTYTIKQELMGVLPKENHADVGVPGHSPEK